jgi:hypothetical protein
VLTLHHRTSSHSKNLLRPDSYTVFARAYGHCEITDKQQKAVKKVYFYFYKYLKKFFIFVNMPYF